ncbi:MAG: hypothetical protein KBT39_00995 [Bacteroidales bacterium]|nr:hypothetical protein [Bacteroidales bacterium]
MKNNFIMKCMACLVMLLLAGSMHAATYPKYPVQSLTDGQTYVLANLARPTGYMCRTDWDNALRIQDKNTFLGQYGVKITAHYDAEKALWYFTTSQEEHAAVEADPENGIEAKDAYTSYKYLGIPAGTNNIRAEQDFGQIPYFEVTPGDAEGFYRLKIAEGHQHTASIGVCMHLNAGGEYPIAGEPTNGWYPDFYGGVELEEDGSEKVIYDEENELYYRVMADSTSCNWAFVLVDDIDRYNDMGAAWKEVADFAKSSYCTDGSDYEAGFLLTLAEAEKLLADGDLEAARATIAAKKALYMQLEAAYNLQEETNTLDGAIEAAVEAFNEKAVVADVEAACEVLKKACRDYEMGLGYITSMGANMSFEDLSSQGGNATSGVAGAPTGWNVYVNGKQVVTADEVRAAGITAWHGINADCAGYKDGNNGFGLWNSVVPEYELSQTISGLENGTYTISCGLMVGANGAGSRRTTQRVFGNQNSTLFASAYDYAEDIFQREYKTYAELDEPVTDTELMQVSVRAYVYDGTLTFGVRTNGDVAAALREGNNGAGGDGWFKVDHFTIYKEGFDANDQKDLFDYLSTSLEKVAAKPMNAEFAETLTAVDDSDMDKGIAQILSILDEAEAEAAAYADLKKAIDEAYERLEICEENGYKGVTAFENAINDVNDNYSNGVYKATEISSIKSLLDEAYQTCLHSGVEEGADVSDLIVNRSFEDLRNQIDPNSGGIDNVPYGWTLKINGVEVSTPDEIRAQGVNAWCAVNQGDNINVEENGVVYNHQYTDGTHVWGIWNASIPQIELSQKLTGLDPGTYVLTADVMARNTDWSGHNLTTQRIFAQDVICLYGMESDYIPECFEGTSSDDIYKAYSLYTEGLSLDPDEGYEFYNMADHDASVNDILLRTLELHFGVDESGEATIGFRTDNLDGWTGEARTEQAAGWFKLDNFTLYFESSKVPENIAVGIKAPVIAGQRAAKGVFDLSGRKYDKAQKGVFIVNGKKVVK